MRHCFLAAATALLIAAANPVAAQSAPAPHAGPPVPAGQLTDAAAPVRYRLDLTVDPARERFSGQVEIDAVLARAAKTIDLHGRDLAVHKVTARVGETSVAGTWKQVDPSGVARITFARTLPAGPVTLAFAYDAAFGDGPSGLFRVKVGTDWHAWSQLAATDARAVFPSFDQPSFKTPFSVTLRTPAGLTAISNAAQTGKGREGDLDVHRFADTLPLPTYLVAIMAGPFAIAESAVPPSPQRAWPLPSRIVTTQQNAKAATFALENTKPIVAHLEDYFGDAFPYPKLDQITTPILPGAMENAGAVLYGDSILILNESAPTSSKRTFGMIVAHELAHQWFGDLVTPVWWDDVWLNESFANWMGYRIGQQWRPDLNIGAGALAEGFAAMNTDALTAGRPIRQPIVTNAQIDSAFDSITYGKGGHVVSMIAAFMGDEKFKSGVRRFMAKHRNATATSTDFFTAMAEAAGDPRIVPAMRSFTDQQGVPLLTFARVGEGWSVTQSRYAPLGASAPAQTWGVPLCVRQGAARQCQLVTEKTDRVAAAGSGPIIPNAGGTGYYRFELAPADWDALIAGAASLDAGEAIALADSLTASVKSGNARAGQLAELARVLASHTDSYAADAGMAGLSGLWTSGVVGEDGRSGWRRFARSVSGPVIARLGFDPRAGAYAGEDPEVSQKRVQAVDRLAAAARDRAVRRKLVRAARAYLAGDRAALDPAWFPRAFDLYLEDGGMPAARSLLEAGLASEDPLFRPTAIDSVAASGDRQVAHWLLDDMRDPRLRPAEQRGFLPLILTSRSTRDLGYEWMRANLDRLLSGNGGIFYSAGMPSWLRRFCAVESAEEFARELRPRFAGKSGALALERVIDQVRDCGVLKQQRGDAITAEFKALR